MLEFILNSFLVRFVLKNIVGAKDSVDLTSNLSFYMVESSSWFKTIKVLNEKVSRRTISFKILKEQNNTKKFLDLIRNDLYNEKEPNQKVYFYRLEGKDLRYYKYIGWLRTYYIHYYME